MHHFKLTCCLFYILDVNKAKTHLQNSQLHKCSFHNRNKPTTAWQEIVTVVETFHHKFHISLSRQSETHSIIAFFDTKYEVMAKYLNKIEKTLHIQTHSIFAKVFFLSVANLIEIYTWQVTNSCVIINHFMPESALQIIQIYANAKWASTSAGTIMFIVICVMLRKKLI